MIFDYLLTTLQGFFSLISYVMPNVDLGDIPYIGDSVRSSVVLAVGYFRGFMETFPYAYALWSVFLALIAFELLLIGLKFFLGSRLPTNHN